MYNEAMDLLKKQFTDCFAMVKNDEFFRAYALEKWRHSMQVMGAGNYLIKRLSWLKNKPAEYIDMVKTAVLLHDVCRFVEIVHLFRGQKGYDHGYGGSLLLQNLVQFDDIRIWLPIKQHGHLIAELYADEQYQNIADEGLRREVELICFLIRDADKIANLHMLAYEPQMRHLFLGKNTCSLPQDRKISELILQNADTVDTLPRDQNSTYADRVAGYLSWFLDINYRQSIEFCDKLEITSKIFDLFAECCDNREFMAKYAQKVRHYLAAHEFLS